MSTPLSPLPSPPPSEMLVITDAIIDAMARNPAFTGNFPCFAGARPAGCGKCGRGRARPLGDYAAIRNCLAGLPDEGKVRLKALLNARKVRLLVQPPGGARRVEWTF